MAGDDNPGGAISLQPSHRPEPRLEAPVVGLEPVVGMGLRVMEGRRGASLLYKREDARDLAEISGLADAGWIDTAWINTGSEGLDAPSHFILGIGSAHRGGIRSRVFCGDGDCLPAIVG